MITQSRFYIGGELVEPASDRVLTVTSPYDQTVVGEAPEAVEADVDRAVVAARKAFDEGEWPLLEPAERFAVLDRFLELYDRRIDELIDLQVAESGLPSYMIGRGGVQAIVTQFLEHGRKMAWEYEQPGVRFGRVHVRREPVGVVGAIVPWNAPQVLAMLKIAPALMTGCTVVHKPAPETPLDAWILAEVLEEAGVPAGVYNLVPADRSVSEYLVRHPGIDKIAFTGSTAAGRKIAAICGEQLKRVSLELGGKSAAIVLDDADLGETITGLRFATMMNSGQACVCQSRVLVSRARYGEVVDALGEMIGGLKVGDPMDPETVIGPLITERQQQRVEGYITSGIDEGAKVVVGGNGMPDGMTRGWFVRPTVFADATNQMRIAREEIFGPVVTVIPYEDEADAVRIANDSEYGLAGSVWTSDSDHGLDVARRVRAGTYGVNCYTIDPGAPFGGYKASGIGREYAEQGIEEYVEFKSIVAL